MQRRTAALLATGLFTLTAAGCSEDSDGNDGADGATADGTTTTGAVVVTTAAPSSTAALPSGPASSPEVAAKGLLTSWEKGDREAASRFARQSAIDELFRQPNTGDVQYQDQGCVPEGGAFLCSWTYPGGVLQMSVEGVLGTKGFVVDSITYIAD